MLDYVTLARSIRRDCRANPEKDTLPRDPNRQCQRTIKIVSSSFLVRLFLVAVRCHLCAGTFTTGSPHLQLVLQGIGRPFPSFSYVSDLGNPSSDAAKGSIHRLAWVSPIGRTHCKMCRPSSRRHGDPVKITLAVTPGASYRANLCGNC